MANRGLADRKMQHKLLDIPRPLVDEEALNWMQKVVARVTVPIKWLGTQLVTFLVFVYRRYMKEYLES